jgi:hypothetical protein
LSTDLLAKSQEIKNHGKKVTKEGVNLPSGEKAKARRKQKAYKVKNLDLTMSMGADIGLDCLEKLASKALVGRFEYASPNRKEIVEWIDKTWKPILGYCPRFFTLLRGWICIQFLSVSDSQKMLDSTWLFGRGSIVLKRWHCEFHPDREPIKIRHLWLKLPGLPLQFWSREALEAIANTVGRFITVDEDNFFSLERKIAKVLIEINIEDGLPAEIRINWGTHVFHQRLDYVGIPFRCLKCRDTGHLKSHCPDYSGNSKVMEERKPTEVDAD